ncbi:ribosome small subunit-dependent GTPase A [Brevibacillus marinus]|uniref:ribosome small subunit-dependent GTPase A n=1 Tax=Brevibacillus marinus TaxID=2496837 RepID=UPI000F8289DB|nr:ribosome small subunit-dependent GTPase A [Brevibacillus marinus]
MNLEAFGWNSFFQNAFAPHEQEGREPARVILEHKHLYRVVSRHGELLADLAGKLTWNAVRREDYPAVGDWVVIQARPEEQRATIHAVLPRRSKFSRKAAWTTMDEQIVAANVDTVLLVSALNHNFNLRRIERYLVLAWESGANPVIVLNKADLCPDVTQKVRETEAVAIGVPIHAVSAETGEGLSQLIPYLTPGKTVALLGSSGVGKSTLVNRLMGRDLQAVQAAREKDDRGRHTTTHRELIATPYGGLIIDTPGMRELQLWEVSDGFTDAFADIEEWAAQCRFRDCGHEAEPGCAVRAAVEAGELDPARLANYRKLLREQAYLERKVDPQAMREEKEKWKKIHRQLRRSRKQQ